MPGCEGRNLKTQEVNMPQRIYYISSEDPPGEYIPQEGPENTVIAMKAQALLRSSIVVVFCRLE